MIETVTQRTEPVAGPRVSTRVLLIGAAVAALAAWLYLEASGNAETGVVLFVGAFAVHAAAAPGIRLMDPRSEDDDRPSPDRPPLGERMEAIAAPGPAIWLLPFVVLPIMLITMPLAYHHSPGNNSIVGLAFACALFGGTVGTIVGSRLWTVLMLAVVTATGNADEGPVSRTIAVRTSYGLAGALLVIAVVGSLFV